MVCSTATLAPGGDPAPPFRTDRHLLDDDHRWVVARGPQVFAASCELLRKHETVVFMPGGLNLFDSPLIRLTLRSHVVYGAWGVVCG